MACVVQLTALDASPNDCALSAGVQLAWEFTASSAVPGAWWEVCYVVDAAELPHAHALPLGRTPAADVAPGAAAAHFACDAIDVAAVPPSSLNNVGLLTLTLRDAGGQEVACSSLLTQITKTPDGQFLRRFISPL